jgi:hypothetical protein
MSDRDSQLANLVRRFQNEEQDPDTVQRVLEKVQQILTSGEEVSYVAVQKRPVVNISPQCVVLTNRRFILYQATVLGAVTFDDHVWRDLKDVKLKEGLLGATMTLRTIAGGEFTIEYLPKAQARRLYAVAQEMEERVHEERRSRELEDKRAAAGGVTLHQAQPGPVPPLPTSSHEPADDPVQKLRRLKDMMDAGLIRAAEYESKKAEILSRM